MDCKEFEKMIPDYIGRQLKYVPLKRFEKHMNNCERCKEEMTIQFLVTEGIQRLEDGGPFDLKKELDQRNTEMKKIIADSERMLNRGKLLRICGFAIILMILIAVIVV